MKKTFKLTHEKIKYDRLVETVRRDVKRYLKRERKKKLPDNTDFWDFNCKFGFTEEEAKVIELADFGKCIDEVQEKKLESFYLEILAKPGHKEKK